MNRIKTDFLTAQSSFLNGVGSVLNIFGHSHEYNASEDPDSIAIGNDWRMIGQDIRDSLEQAAAEGITATEPNERQQAA